MTTWFPPFSIFHRWFLCYLVLILKPLNGISTELGHFNKENKQFCCPKGARGDDSQKDTWMFTLHFGRKITETTVWKKMKLVNEKLKLKAALKSKKFYNTTSATACKAITGHTMEGRVEPHSHNAVLGDTYFKSRELLITGPWVTTGTEVSASNFFIFKIFQFWLSWIRQLIQQPRRLSCAFPWK